MTVWRTDLLNPTLAQILTTFQLDKVYLQGEGNYLIDDKGIYYLDFIAQYGAVPFGYNPAFIWEALDKVRHDKMPSLVQPSLPHEALRLANRLAELTPGDLCYSTFCQSGAEAVEAAIKLARSATGRPIIISTLRSFHGKTLGALSATGREVYQQPFYAPAPGFLHIPYNDTDALQAVINQYPNEIAAFIVEPIQGEGGMVVAQPGYLQAVQELCRAQGIVFIVDEIQTGLGRTGYLFACEEHGIEPDILLLAKALGGGLMPLGVCISSPQVYNDDFGALHSSTFANNNVTCAVGNAVLDLLQKNDGQLIKEVQAKGDYLLGRAQELYKLYPDVIKEVRGQGLMIGIEFYEMTDCGSLDMAFLVDQGGFTGLLAGYLLNVHQIRLAPFLNNPMTVRLEPPLTITYEEIDRVIEVLKQVCQIISYRDYSQLYRYLIGDNKKPNNIINYQPISRQIKYSALATEEQEAEKEKFAFIIHYPGPEDVIANNPSFGTWSRDEVYKFLQWQSQLTEPAVVCHMPAVKSASGAVAEGWLIGVPLGAREIMSFPRQQVVDLIAQAVDLGKDMGAKMVGLGALTSVVTRGGRSMQGRDVAITSGNSFTTLMAIEALFKGATQMRIDVQSARGAVVGATGSIGRACALILSEQVQDITLLGNPEHPTSSKNRLGSLQSELLNYARQRSEQGYTSGLAGWYTTLWARLNKKSGKAAQQLMQRLNTTEGISKDLIEEACSLVGMEFPIKTSLFIDQTLPQCNMIIAASNSPEYLIYSHHLAPGAVVCDVARPADVSPTVYQTRDDVLILEGGLVEYPDLISFGPNLGYREGVSLACLSETVLLTLEADYQDYSIGTKLSLETIAYLRELGKKHGFKLAGLVMNGREIDDAEIENIYHRSCQSLQSANNF